MTTQMTLFTRDAPTGQPHRSDEPPGSEPQGTGPNQPPHSAATSRGTRRIGRLLVAAGLALLPWMYVLAAGLPAVMTAPRWPAAWIGLDILEAAGLIGTGLLAARGDRRHALAAAATTALLVVDAWFDTMTATSTSDLGAAIAMALCPELPLAAVCGWLAIRAQHHTILPRRELPFPVSNPAVQELDQSLLRPQQPLPLLSGKGRQDIDQNLPPRNTDRIAGVDPAR